MFLSQNKKNNVYPVNKAGDLSRRATFARVFRIFDVLHADFHYKTMKHTETYDFRVLFLVARLQGVLKCVRVCVSKSQEVVGPDAT